MSQDSFNHELLQFLHKSPTPFHAVQCMAQELEDNGFELLSESDPWQPQSGGRYLVIRNDASLVACILGDTDPDHAAIRLVGAHTDSPCLKVKPEPDISQHGSRQVAVEVYGGVLLNPWFDRELSLAGRVTFRDRHGHVASVLVNFQKPLAIIPSLAIHLDREANSKRSINPQQHIYPVIAMNGDEDSSLRDLIQQQIVAEYGDLEIDLLLDYDLCFYDAQPPAIAGLKDEFITSARLDNLLSCFTGLKAMIKAGESSATSILACHDHEEVGSMSMSGAQGPFLDTVLHRLFPDRAERSRIVARSLMISADNAHALHPNFADRHDTNHQPLLNGGPVIKFNANQRYATNSETAALFRNLCIETGVPVQTMAMRNDMTCGSTIGPISASELGIATVDVGAPQWAMHSIRETTGVRDPYYLYRVLQAFFNG